MLRLFRSVVAGCFAVFVAFAALAADAQERRITLLPGTDLPGFDYSILKGVTAPECQAACAEDNICRAFTFNEKARWCFLKGTAGVPEQFTGATSGRVDLVPSAAVTNAVRQQEIPFPAYGLVESARQFAIDLANTNPPPQNLTYGDLVQNGDEGVDASNFAGAEVSYRQALGINANDPGLWLKLAAVLLTRADEQARLGNSTYGLGQTATYAAINAFLRSYSIAERASSLSALAHALERREMWRESIATYRQSLALVDSADLQARLDAVVAQHGFRIVSNEVDSESITPRICVVFSESLPTTETDLSGYVVVEGAPNVAVETQDAQICLEGVNFGTRYNIRVRQGLPSAAGEKLLKDAEINVFIPDRSPFVGFANNAYVMPAGLGGGLPITSINAESADVVIYRIGDRSIATAVRNGLFRRTLDQYSAEDIAFQYGEKVFEGTVDLAQGTPNQLGTTAIPVGDAIGQFEPGAYVITAKVTGEQQEYWMELATQWFIVTDLGLTTIAGNDGVHVFVRSLTTAEPVAAADVRLIARNNEILGEATSDAEGAAVFAPGLARGEGGNAPQVLVAETAAGDYAFLDLSGSAFDLTDRGVEGRPAPGPLDVFATTERGVYRPGEMVFLTALVRDALANAVTGLPLTLELERPDGVVASTQVLSDQGAGGYFAALPLISDAMRGAWQIRLYADTKAAPLAYATFLVEDFEPERLAFEVSAGPESVVLGAVTEINVAAKYLYGATAPDLAVEADVVLRPTTTLPEFPGYTFGREDDTIETERMPLGFVGTTDEAGNAVAAVTIPSPRPTTRPLEAQIILRLVDSNGRPVERNLTRAVRAETDRIGVRPQFEDFSGLEQGSSAAFDVIAVSPDNEIVARTGLVWSLSRVETSYQWYRESGSWKWEAITTTRRIANGSIDTVAGGPVTIAAPVDWGRYLLEIETTGEGATSTSYEFWAGYYYPEAGSNTPDTLEVALDKTAYRVGDTATLQLQPQFAGTALVMVVDDRVIDMIAVEVPAEGTSVAIPVTEEWGPGAYVTAILYRPASAAEKRMPARALGLAYADVDPGDRKLAVELDAPDVALPRQPFTVTVKIPNATAGEQAYVAVAAVDLGILNLTNFQTPDPDGWYFGQRQLGMEVRDLYGQLIDPTQGMPGAVRSGGDATASRSSTPPATSVLVAQHSGIVTVGADGTATVTFDMPDFAGTVRLMAMAWTATAVGHAQADVIVRDPVVVTMSPPRFLRLDDTSRLLVEINNISGPVGAYTMELITGAGIITDAAEQTIELGAGGRASLDLGLTGTEIGNQEVRLIVTDPGGNALVKRLTLGVRAVAGPRTTSTLIPIEPGGTVVLDAAYFEGIVPHSGTLTLALGPIARLNVPELLLALDRYPYGCAEQVTSRVFPLLYLNEVATTLGLGADAALDQRIEDAIVDLLSKQTSVGSFGVWGPFSYTSFWLDAYVTDFLLQAKAEGYAIPERALEMALDNLGNQVSYASDFDGAGEDIAYALYDLARAGRAAIGDLRYYFEARLDAFGSPLAKAQLGAALALYGDRTRASEAFQASVAGLKVREDRYRYRSDYGSQLRDMAGVLALAGEFEPSGVDLPALAGALADLRDRAKWTSTQEDAWTLLAAAQLAREAGDGTVTIDGEPLTGTVYRRYNQDRFEGDGSVTLVNTSNQPTEVKVSVTGIPSAPPPTANDGFLLTRDYYTLEGEIAEMSTIAQNDRFVVVITATPTTLGSGQYIVSDPIPAGFEIENPNLTASGVSDLSWLSLQIPSHTEARTDQFIAAFRYLSEAGSFTAAYVVRAVSPGTFWLPGATVEDMYRPELRANTDAGSIEITKTGP